jgi:hypothetical protein
VLGGMTMVGDMFNYGLKSKVCPPSAQAKQRVTDRQEQPT